MALHLKLRPKPLTPLPIRSLRRSSSSSTSPPPPPPPDSSNGGEENEASSPPPRPPSYPSFSSYFSDIKERLKSSPSPPRRIPDNPPPPSSSSAGPSSGPAASLEEIRKHLAEFRLKSNPPPRSSPSSPAPISFQELFKNNVLSKPGDGPAADRPERLSFDSIRESLRQFRASSPADQRRPSESFSLRAFQESLRDKGSPSSILGGGPEKLPDSIFGKELREKKGEGEGEGERKALKTEFVKLYNYEELGEKLRRLRPDESKKGGNQWFSLHELNKRLAKLREMEERETESRMGGVSFRDLRESLVRLKEADANKKADSRVLAPLQFSSDFTLNRFILKD